MCCVCVKITCVQLAELHTLCSSKITIGPPWLYAFLDKRKNMARKKLKKKENKKVLKKALREKK